ncbi:hypothetical protein U9M48_019500 [Paspalum notatum var. saurae]|uniref:Uncharacterized protein n=1 Tax=Paspalum notatum var. saurae TaxID=547442 RepID=A0AAQ3TF43_PASNO
MEAPDRTTHGRTRGRRCRARRGTTGGRVCLARKRGLEEEGPAGRPGGLLIRAPRQEQAPHHGHRRQR